MALIPTRLQQVLAGLREKISGRAETAYSDRDAADQQGEHDARVFAAGEAHAYAKDDDSVRDAEDEAAN